MGMKLNIHTPANAASSASTSNGVVRAGDTSAHASTTSAHAGDTVSAADGAATHESADAAELRSLLDEITGTDDDATPNTGALPSLASSASTTATTSSGEPAAMHALSQLAGMICAACVCVCVCVCVFVCV
jgi:hypothetical protein